MIDKKVDVKNVEIMRDNLYISGKKTGSHIINENNFRFYYQCYLEMKRTFRDFDGWYLLAEQLNNLLNKNGWVSGNANPHKHKILISRKSKDFLLSEMVDIIELVKTIPEVYDKIFKIEISKENIIIAFK